MSLRKTLDNLLERFLVLLLAILVIDVLWQVFSRYILNEPSSFTDELAGFLLIWVGILGTAYVAGKNEHLAIDLLLNKISGAKKKKLEVFIQISILLFALTVLVVGGLWLVYTRFALDVKSAALQIPLGYVYIVLPLSGICICIYSISNIFSTLKS